VQPKTCMITMLKTRGSSSSKVYTTICKITFEIMHFFANSQVVAIATSVTAHARYPWADTFGRNWPATESSILHAYHRLMRGPSHDIVHLLIKLDDISLVDSSYSCSHVDNVRDCQSGQSPCCCAVRNAPSVNPTPTTPKPYTALYARVVFPIGKGESASVGP
jgi:hypothetical protein